MPALSPLLPSHVVQGVFFFRLIIFSGESPNGKQEGQRAATQQLGFCCPTKSETQIRRVRRAAAPRKAARPQRGLGTARSPPVSPSPPCGCTRCPGSPRLLACLCTMLSRGRVRPAQFYLGVDWEVLLSCRQPTPKKRSAWLAGGNHEQC